MNELNPLVSVVATCYCMERFQDVIELLTSLECQTYRNFEVVLVIEKSRELADRVAEFVEKRGIQNIRMLFETDSRGLSKARNTGVESAKGSIMAFIDDDAVASPSWLSEIVLLFSHNADAIGVTGHILPNWEDVSMNWFPRELYWVFACTTEDDGVPRKVRNGYGTNMSFRREAFEKGGLFLTQLGARGGGRSGKHELVGEDTEFSVRVAQKTRMSIIYSPRILVYHRAYKYRLRSSYLARRGYWEGYTKALFRRISLLTAEKDMLSTEQRLLRRIVLRLGPSIIVGLPTRPTASLQRARVTLVVLLFVGIGYVRGSLRCLTSREVIA
jgi:glucosyl-dolichyl phosphate glucuronosyltransferase